MSSLKKKAIVVMLSTEKAQKNILTLNKNYPSKSSNTLKIRNSPWFDSFTKNKWINQHLYFLSDEEIKEGDWFINDLNQIKKCTSRDTQSYIDFEGGFNTKPSSCKKVIATTDSSLGLIKDNSIFPSKEVRDFYLPQPSPQFVEAYIKSFNEGNIITEVMVEFEAVPNEYDNPFTNPKGLNNFEGAEWKLKTDSNNYITITKVKESFTKEEVANLIRKAMQSKGYTPEYEVIEFCKQNL